MVQREDIIRQANFIVETHATVRQTAEVFGISKSSVHFYMTNKLPHISFALYEKVHRVLSENFAARYIRGGMATKRKYETMKKT